MTFSTTQISNYVTLIVFLVNLFKINIAPEEIQQIVSAIIILISIGINIVNRFSKGDITALGARK